MKEQEPRPLTPKEITIQYLEDLQFRIDRHYMALIDKAFDIPREWSRLEGKCMDEMRLVDEVISLIHRYDQEKQERDR